MLGARARGAREELDNVKANDEIDPLLLRTHPRSEHYLLRLYARTGLWQALAGVAPVPVVPKWTGHHCDAFASSMLSRRSKLRAPGGSVFGLGLPV